MFKSNLIFFFLPCRQTAGMLLKAVVLTSIKSYDCDQLGPEELHTQPKHS